jgi:hypothetical protein
MSNGAKIITNGNRLVLVSLSARFGENAGIASFASDAIKASAGADGLSGGKVRIQALQGVSGGLRVFLPGQNGGEGKLPAGRALSARPETGEPTPWTDSGRAKAADRMEAKEGRAERAVLDSRAARVATVAS